MRDDISDELFKIWVSLYIYWFIIWETKVSAIVTQNLQLSHAVIPNDWSTENTLWHHNIILYVA